MCPRTGQIQDEGTRIDAFVREGLALRLEAGPAHLLAPGPDFSPPWESTTECFAQA
jgi:hypothetical protein